jgi:hypothetical protein
LAVNSKTPARVEASPGSFKEKVHPNNKEYERKEKEYGPKGI